MADAIDQRPCECGCGELANPGRRFLKGHNRRGVPAHNRGEQYPGQRAAYQREYRKRNPGWKAETQRRYRERNRERLKTDPVEQQKYQARLALNRAIANGSVAREPCKGCGKTEGVQGHHADYSKPLEVEWLCPACHTAEHWRPHYSLTDEQVREMRRKFRNAADRSNVNELAEEFGLEKDTVQNIVYGRAYAWVR